MILCLQEQERLHELAAAQTGDAPARSSFVRSSTGGLLTTVT